MTEASRGGRRCMFARRSASASAARVSVVSTRFILWSDGFAVNIRRMMIRDALVVEAVVPFDTGAPSFRMSVCGADETKISSVVRLGRRPASETDVVDGRGELVTRVGLVCSRWELRRQHDDALVAEGALSPIALRPFAPLPYVVRLFGRGTAA
jgi:hypothetical protein